MTDKGSLVNLDDAVATVARRYRLEATATLIAVCRDESAPAAARTAAAERILAYSDGRPTTTKHVTAQDVLAMSRAERDSLWRALFDVETEFPDFVLERIQDTISRSIEQLAQPRLNRFTRGTPPPPAEHLPPSRSSARAQATKSAQRNSGEPSVQHTAHPSPPRKPVLKRLAPIDVDQATGLPLKRLADGAPDTRSISANEPTAIDGTPRILRDVVERSARPNGSNGVAHAAFGSYRPWWNR